MELVLAHRHRTIASILAAAAFLGLAAFFLWPDIVKPRAEGARWYSLHIAGGSVALVVGAIWSVRAGHILVHQHNMARGYLSASYFVTVRVVDRFGLGLLAPFVDSEDARLAHSDWLAWVLPLVVLEIYFGRKLAKALPGRAALGRGVEPGPSV